MIIPLESCLLFGKLPHFQYIFCSLTLFQSLLTTCLPTDSEKRPAGGMFPRRAILFCQLALRLHRFLAWKVVMMRSMGFASRSMTSALAIPRSIFTAALCRISSVIWE